MSKAAACRSRLSHSASMKTGLMASSAWRAVFQKSVGTKPATSQRKPSTSTSRTH